MLSQSHVEVFLEHLSVKHTCVSGIHSVLPAWGRTQKSLAMNLNTVTYITIFRNKDLISVIVTYLVLYCHTHKSCGSEWSVCNASPDVSF